VDDALHAAEAVEARRASALAAPKMVEGDMIIGLCYMDITRSNEGTAEKPVKIVMSGLNERTQAKACN
tara:strand:+ start:16950 stop:17153 length:204 start_codon:yes stop_codon:yes gene_type:complete